jgi:hypothetical protein
MRLLRPVLVVASAGALGALVEANPLFSSGPPTEVASNRPFYNNCTTCHTGTVNSGAGSVTIAGVPTVFTPGMTYALTVTDADPTARRWGFELTAQHKSGARAGGFSLTDPMNTQLLVGAAGVEYVQHTMAGTYAGTMGPRSWMVEWSAPAAAAGDVVFAVSGNAANNNGFNTGDRIYNNAVLSAAPDGSVPPALIGAQPNLTNPRRGSSWVINCRVTNAAGGAATYNVVSRIRLPNGSYYPASGWLAGPTSLTLAAGASGNARFTHTVPAGAPLLSATYEMYVRDAAGVVLDGDTFAFTVTP